MFDNARGISLTLSPYPKILLPYAPSLSTSTPSFGAYALSLFPYVWSFQTDGKNLSVSSPSFGAYALSLFPYASRCKYILRDSRHTPWVCFHMPWVSRQMEGTWRYMPRGFLHMPPDFWGMPREIKTDCLTTVWARFLVLFAKKYKGKWISAHFNKI